MTETTTEPAPMHWEGVLEPWRLTIGFECGTHWYNFWRRGMKFRTFESRDEKIGMHSKGFAVGAVMVSWGKHAAYHLVP